MDRVGQASGDVVWPMRSWRTDGELESYLAVLPKESLARAEAFWSSQGLIVGPKAGRGVWIEGRRDYLAKQNQVDAQSAGQAEIKIQLGDALAKILGVVPGDLVQLRLPGVVIHAVRARVTKLLSYGMYEIDSRAAIIDDISLRSYLAAFEPDVLAKRPGDAHGFRFFLNSSKDPDAFKDLAQTELRTMLSEGDVELLGVREQKANLFRGIGYNKRELSLILGLLTLVAGLNVAASLVVLFLERDRDFALIQALGASRTQLFLWISTLGLILGLIGSALGLVLGRVLGLGLQQLPIARIPPEIYNLAELPLKFDFHEQLILFLGGALAALACAAALAASLSRMNLVGVLGSKR